MLSENIFFCEFKVRFDVDIFEEHEISPVDDKDPHDKEPFIDNDE